MFKPDNKVYRFNFIKGVYKMPDEEIKNIEKDIQETNEYISQHLDDEEKIFKAVLGMARKYFPNTSVIRYHINKVTTAGKIVMWSFDYYDLTETTKYEEDL